MLELDNIIESHKGITAMFHLWYETSIYLGHTVNDIKVTSYEFDDIEVTNCE